MEDEHIAQTQLDVTNKKCFNNSQHELKKRFRLDCWISLDRKVNKMYCAAPSQHKLMSNSQDILKVIEDDLG